MINLRKESWVILIDGPDSEEMIFSEAPGKEMHDSKEHAEEVVAKLKFRIPYLKTARISQVKDL